MWVEGRSLPDSGVLGVQVLGGQRLSHWSWLLLLSLHWTPGFQQALVKGVVVKMTSSSDSRCSVGCFLGLRPKFKLSLKRSKLKLQTTQNGACSFMCYKGLRGLLHPGANIVLHL